MPCVTMCFLGEPASRRFAVFLKASTRFVAIHAFGFLASRAISNTVRLRAPCAP